MVGLHVCLEHGDDLRALRLGQREVLVDEIDVRVDHREGAVCLAPEEIRGARGLVVQELSEVHGGPPGGWRHRLDKLSSDLLNNNGWMPAARRTRCSKRSR